jgi:hypothetical protein
MIESAAILLPTEKDYNRFLDDSGSSALVTCSERDRPGKLHPFSQPRARATDRVATPGLDSLRTAPASRQVAWLVATVCLRSLRRAMPATLPRSLPSPTACPIPGDSLNPLRQTGQPHRKHLPQYALRHQSGEPLWSTATPSPEPSQPPAQSPRLQRFPFLPDSFAAPPVHPTGTATCPMRGIALGNRVGASDRSIVGIS